MSSAQRLLAFALVVASLACIDTFARVTAVAFIYARDGQLVRADSPEAFFLSFWYTVPLVTFLALHEGGHLVMARHCGVQHAGPYFIPLPIWLIAASQLPIPAIGTLGAYSRIGDATPEDRWRIALAGPLVGIGFAFACVCIGSALSEHGAGYTVYVPHVLRLFTDGAVWHPMLLAGYVGVLITGINLFPLSPGFDGWHLLRTFDDLDRGRKAWTVAAWGLGCLCLV